MSTATVDATHYDSNGTWLAALHGEHDLATVARTSLGREAEHAAIAPPTPDP